MMAHRLIDVLTAHPSSNFVVSPGADKDCIVGLIRQAEKFDFGTLVLEPTETIVHGRPTWTVPKLTPEENSFIDQGLVPLPAPICWYEFTLGDSTSGFLVLEDWKITRVDFDRHQNKGIMDGVWTKASQDGRIEIYGNYVILNQAAHRGNLDKFIATMSYASNMDLIRYLTLMINSRSTHIEHVNGKRPGSASERPGKREPKHDHRIVTIVPKEYIALSRAEGTRSHASPRLHWRRSHLRTYASGRKVVISRCLVGKAELGTISHEYKVPS